MAEQQNPKLVTAIVPAYNEATRIAPVLEVLTTYPGFKEIIVVDDGSTDETGAIAQRYPVRFIQNPKNRGKGHAMDRAIQLAKTDVVFFCDADVSGLTHQMIREITAPVLAGKADMFIGMRNRNWYVSQYILSFVPLLGGERAITKTLWNLVPSFYKTRFRIEAGLNFYAKYYGKGYGYKFYKQFHQVIKEKKYGFWKGMAARMRLYYNVLSAQAKLSLVEVPKSIQNRRKLLLYLFQSVTGMIVGALFFVATYIGPREFVYRLFAHELAEDPDAPFVHFLLYLAGVVGVHTIIVLGGLLFFFNFLIFLFTFRKILQFFDGKLPETA